MCAKWPLDVLACCCCMGCLISRGLPQKLPPKMGEDNHSWRRLANHSPQPVVSAAVPMATPLLAASSPVVPTKQGFCRNSRARVSLSYRPSLASLTPPTLPLLGHYKTLQRINIVIHSKIQPKEGNIATAAMATDKDNFPCSL